MLEQQPLHWKQLVAHPSWSVQAGSSQGMGCDSATE